MRSKWLALLAITLAVVLGACSQIPEEAETPHVTPQFGRSGNDRVTKVLVDPKTRAVFLSAYLNNGTSSDVVLRRYSRSGSLVWQRSVMDNISYPELNSIYGPAQTPDGNLVVVANFGTDLVKYSSAGNELWRTYVGDPGYCDTVILHFPQDIEVDAQGNIYVMSGYDGGGSRRCSPGFLSKFDGSGNLLWQAELSQFSSDLEVAPDGTTFVAGYVGNSVITKRSASGNIVWEKELLTSPTNTYSTAEIRWLSGRLYLVGKKTFGDAVGAETDAFIAKFTRDGTRDWLRTFGTRQPDYADSLAQDSQGNLYVAGSTQGRFEGNNSFGDFDLFVRKLAPNGLAFWTRQIGSPKYDSGKSIALLNPSELYLAGDTEGDLGADNRGASDAFLMRLDSTGANVWIR